MLGQRTAVYYPINSGLRGLAIGSRVVLGNMYFPAEEFHQPLEIQTEFQLSM